MSKFLFFLMLLIPAGVLANTEAPFVGGIITVATGFLAVISYLTYFNGPGLWPVVIGLFVNYAVTIALDIFLSRKLRYQDTLTGAAILNGNVLSYGFHSAFVVLRSFTT